MNALQQRLVDLSEDKKTIKITDLLAAKVIVSLKKNPDTESVGNTMLVHGKDLEYSDMIKTLKQLNIVLSIETKSGKVNQVGDASGSICSNCKKKGHLKKDCWAKGGGKEGQYPNRRKKGNSKKENEGTNKIATVFSALKSNGEMWLLDSGAANHMTNDKSMLKDIKPLKNTTSEKFRAANGGMMTAESSGTLQFKNHDGFVVSIKDVLYVPQLKANLISLAELQDKGAITTFKRRDIIITHPKSKISIVGKRMDDKTFAIQGTLWKTVNAVQNTKENNNLWHQRMGHLTNAGKTLEKEGMGKAENIPKDCHDCMKAKIKVLTFKDQTNEQNRAKAPLEIIHTDVWGPATSPGKDGYKSRRLKYFVTFIDEFSGHVKVKCMKSKSEVPGHLKENVTLMENQLDKRVKQIKCDNGTEYINNEVITFCNSKGILLNSTNPYQPTQNPRAERMNGTLLNMLRSMINTAHLGSEYWPYAVRTAAHIYNCTIKESIGVSPMKKLFGKDPELNYLKVWGCLTVAHVPKPRSKLENRGETCVFLEYTNNWYALESLETGKLVYSRNVKFIEDQFVNNIAEIESTDENDNVLDDDSDSDYRESEKEADDAQGSDDNPGTSSNAPTRIQPLRQAKKVNVVAPAMGDPTTYAEAIQIPCWREAINSELESIAKNQTWEIVDLPEGAKTLDSKWVFKTKYNPDGSFDKYKARLTVRGFKAVSSKTFEERYAPVPSMTTVRIAMALAAQNDLVIEKLDIKSAFTYSYLKEPVYMKLPDGVVCTKKNLKRPVCKLIRALYGMPDSAHLWNEDITKTLVDFGFRQSSIDPCFFIYKGENNFFLFIWVDDILSFRSKSSAMHEELKEALKQKYEIKDFGYNTGFLGMTVKQIDNEVILKQEAYVQELENKYGLEEAKTNKIPGNKTVLKLEGETSANYQAIIGSLNYVACRTRPDIAFSVSHGAQFLTQSGRILFGI